MIYSPRHDCVFFSVPKTGSTSIRLVLVRQAGFRDYPLGNEDLWSHEELCNRDMLSRWESLEPNIARASVMAFVRHPALRLLSGFRWMQQRGRIPQTVSFAGFVRSGLSSTDPSVQWHTAVPQTSLLFREGVCVADFLGRYENLNADFARMCHQFGLPQHPLPLCRQTRRKDENLRSVFDLALLHIVEEIFAEDYENFGYARGESSLFEVLLKG